MNYNFWGFLSGSLCHGIRSWKGTLEFLARPEDLGTHFGCPGPGLPSEHQEEVSCRWGPGMWMETRVCLCFREEGGS